MQVQIEKISNVALQVQFGLKFITYNYISQRIFITDYLHEYK